MTIEETIKSTADLLEKIERSRDFIKKITGIKVRSISISHPGSLLMDSDCSFDLPAFLNGRIKDVLIAILEEDIQNKQVEIREIFKTLK